jgi:hypothetical protein
MTQTVETAPAYRAPLFSHARIAHGFFGRRGGISEGVYASLNCAYGSDDFHERVAENRGRVADTLGVARGDLASARQVHGTRCHAIEAPLVDRHARPEGDALVTDRPGLALAVSTADCVPVLLCAYSRDADRPVIGAAHAGWAGALNGVLEAVCDRMRTLGAKTDTIMAATGPAIRQASYAVSSGFETPFIEEDAYAAHFFKDDRRGDNKLYFDLPGYVAYRLSRLGLSHIHICDHDTYTQEESYFSYRRTVHSRAKHFGCQFSAIAIRDV